MNTIYEFDFKDNHYVLKVNLSVYQALDKLQTEKQRKVFTPEILSLLNGADLEEMEKGNVDLKQLAPLLNVVPELQQAEISVFDVFKCILKTLYGTTEQQYNEIIQYLENELGTQELCEKLKEIKDKAFTLVEQISKAIK